jgi:hypothetical protein
VTPASTEARIQSFTLAGVSGSINHSSNPGTITVSGVPYSTNLNGLVPTIVLMSSVAAVSPSGAQDFSSAKSYTVTAQDGTTTKTYTVTVTKAAPPEPPALSISAVGNVYVHVKSKTIPDTCTDTWTGGRDYVYLNERANSRGENYIMMQGLRYDNLYIPYIRPQIGSPDPDVSISPAYGTVLPAGDFDFTISKPGYKSLTVHVYMNFVY